jgi:F-type H+-transporting ATPase subunit delta
MSAASVRAEAKRLLAMSLEGGVVSADLVGAVLAALTKSRASHQLRPLLRAYLANIRRELARGEARIEHAGPLSPSDADAIAAHFSKVLGRAVRLAGFRVRVGDDVTDLTASLRLANLAKSLS